MSGISTNPKTLFDEKPNSHALGLRRFVSDCSGGVMALYGVALPMLIGFGAFATDLGLWYGNQRSAQSIADSAAIAAALETARGQDESAAIQAAQDDAERNGFDTSFGTISVKVPASAGPFKGQAGTAEALVQLNPQGFLASVFLGDSTTIAAWAVARTTPDNKCAWVMDPAESGALTYQGSTDISLDCGIAVKSNHPEAIKNTSGACLDSTMIEVVGGYNADCISPVPITGVAAESIMDPLEYLPPPSYGACDYGAMTYNGVDTMSPGVYCGNVRLNSSAEVTMDPGIYVLDNNAEFRVNGGASLQGDGVIIYFTDDADRVHLSGGSVVNLSAPTSGTYKGILFYIDRDGDPTTVQKFTGGANMQLDGTLYAPAQKVEFAGGSVAQTVNSNIVARTLKFVGNSEVEIAPSTIIPAAMLDPVLVE